MFRRRRICKPKVDVSGIQKALILLHFVLVFIILPVLFWRINVSIKALMHSKFRARKDNTKTLFCFYDLDLDLMTMQTWCVFCEGNRMCKTSYIRAFSRHLVTHGHIQSRDKYGGHHSICCSQKAHAEIYNVCKYELPASCLWKLLSQHTHRQDRTEFTALWVVIYKKSVAV